MPDATEFKRRGEAEQEAAKNAKTERQRREHLHNADALLRVAKLLSKMPGGKQ